VYAVLSYQCMRSYCYIVHRYEILYPIYFGSLDILYWILCWEFGADHDDGGTDNDSHSFHSSSNDTRPSSASGRYHLCPRG
jgi:hypothetical protein